jgi:hypothetical protein
VGIDKDLAKQARTFAALPEAKFEALVKRRAEAAVAAMAGDNALIKAIRLEQQAEKKEAPAADWAPKLARWRLPAWPPGKHFRLVLVDRL